MPPMIVAAARDAAFRTLRRKHADDGGRRVAAIVGFDKRLGVELRP
jgi:hypothetical protein